MKQQPPVQQSLFSQEPPPPPPAAVPPTPEPQPVSTWADVLAGYVGGRK